MQGPTGISNVGIGARWGGLVEDEDLWSHPSPTHSTFLVLFTRYLRVIYALFTRYLRVVYLLFICYLSSINDLFTWYK